MKDVIFWQEQYKAHKVTSFIKGCQFESAFSVIAWDSYSYLKELHNLFSTVSSHCMFLSASFLHVIFFWLGDWKLFTSLMERWRHILFALWIWQVEFNRSRPPKNTCEQLKCLNICAANEDCDNWCSAFEIWMNKWQMTARVRGYHISVLRWEQMWEEIAYCKENIAYDVWICLSLGNIFWNILSFERSFS